jgi:hypothetical protein
MLSQRYRNEKKDCLNLKEMSTSCLPKKPLNLIVLLFLGFGSGRGKYSAENSMRKQSTPYSKQFPSCSLESYSASYFTRNISKSSCIMWIGGTQAGHL